MESVTTTFAEEFVRDATRYVVRAEYRSILTYAVVASIVGAALVWGLSVAGILPEYSMQGILGGLVAAVVTLGVLFIVAYRQSLRFSMLVFQNEGVGEVGYQLSEAGCVVRYKGAEILLPWDCLRTRKSFGQYVVLGFGQRGQSNNRLTTEVLNAMSQHRSGPEFLGFPIFCSVPRPGIRYVFVPISLVRESLHIPTEIG